MPNTMRLPRGKRPTRAAAANAQAINNIISRSRVVKAAKAAVAARPRPAGGVGVKKMRKGGVRRIKIKKPLPQAKIVEVKKNGVVIRKMNATRKTYFPGKKRRTY